MNQPTKITPAYFDLAGASAYLGGAISVRTLRRLIAEPDGLPYYQIGARGKIMIKREDLDAFMGKYRREPVDLRKLADEALEALRKK